MLHNNKKSTITCCEFVELEITHDRNLLPFQSLNVGEGIKYLGFHVKPNDYTKEDWMWMVAKVERKINSWCHKWLSRAGKFIPVKSVIKATTVF